MTYFSIQHGVIVKHRRRHVDEADSIDVADSLPTISLRCEVCGWSPKAIDPTARVAETLDKPEHCICGGRLVVVKQKPRKS